VTAARTYRYGYVGVAQERSPATPNKPAIPFKANSSHRQSTVERDMGRLTWPILGLMATALAGVIALEFRSTAIDGQSGMPAPNRQPLALAHAPPSNGRVDSSQKVGILLARPLFRPNRRPAAGIANPTDSSLKSLPRLTGVVVSPVGKFAIFANAEGGKPVVIGEGGHVGAAVIEAIEAGQVTVRGPDGTVVLHSAFDEKILQASRPNPADPAKPRYRQLPMPFHPSPRVVAGK